MNTKIKDYLGVALIIASLAFSFASINYAANQPDFSERTFSASASSKVVAKPDIGQFTFSIITEGGTNLGELQDENSATVETITNFLTEGGVEKEDIETQNFNVQPRREYHECRLGTCPPSEIVGYSIDHALSVKIRNLDNAGELLTGVVDRGANYVSSLSFTIDNPDTLEAQAQGEAIAKAKEKAKAIAKAGGFRVGKIVSVHVVDSPSMMPFRATMESADFGIGGAVPVEPGSEEIEVEVVVTYEIR